MKNLIAKAGLALALGATALTVSAPASAQRYGGGYRHHDNTGTAIVAGVAGLAVGAALASSARDDRGYYEPDYYVDGGYDGYAYPAYPAYRAGYPIYQQRYYSQRYYAPRAYRYDGYRGGGYRGGGYRGGYGGGYRGGNHGGNFHGGGHHR